MFVIREQIKADLLDRLEQIEKNTEYNRSLIDDYMNYYDLKEKMIRDIKNRGLVITQKSGNGFERKVINENVAEVQKITRLMLKIIQDLGLNSGTIEEELDLSEFY